MKVNVQEINSVQRQVEVTVPAGQVDKLQDKLYQRLKKQARLKGFRQGKAPRSILERYYGPQVAAETAENLISETYPQALEEAGLEPLARPDFDFLPPKAGEDWTYQVTLDVRPEFELPKEAYTGLELREPDLQVTEEEVGQRLEELRARQAVLAPLEEERPAGAGDVVVVNYTSFADGEPLEGGEADNVEVELGSGQNQEEIEVALLKTKPGDIVEATVDYPQDANNPQVAGKTVTFKLVVKDIKQKVLPELDDDFARSVGPEFDTLQALTDRIRQELEKNYQQQKDQALKAQIFEKLQEAGEFDLPGSLVEEEMDNMAQGFKERLRQSGMDPDQVGLDDEKIKADFRPQAERKVRAGIVLGQISDQEQVEVTDEDLDAEIQRVADQVGQPAKVVREMYSKNKMMPQLSAQVLEEKTLQVVKAGATITPVDPAELAKESAGSAQGSDQGEEPETTDTSK
jgi:trigger factor